MDTIPLTQWLQAWQAAPNDQAVADRLARAVYAQLRDIARHRLRLESDAGLGATELVHETWMRLSPTGATLRDRAHFFRLASLTMRHFLIDQARERLATRHGGGGLRVSLTLADTDSRAAVWPDERLLDLDRALRELANDHARAAETLTLRCFGGLSLDDIAQATDTSLATVKRDLAFARAWLTDAMGTRTETPDP